MHITGAAGCLINNCTIGRKAVSREFHCVLACNLFRLRDRDCSPFYNMIKGNCFTLFDIAKRRVTNLNGNLWYIGVFSQFIDVALGIINGDIDDKENFLILTGLEHAVVHGLYSNSIVFRKVYATHCDVDAICLILPLKGVNLVCGLFFRLFGISFISSVICFFYSLLRSYIKHTVFFCLKNILRRRFFSVIGRNILAEHTAAETDTFTKDRIAAFIGVLNINAVQINRALFRAGCNRLETGNRFLIFRCENIAIHKKVAVKEDRFGAAENCSITGTGESQTLTLTT